MDIILDKALRNIMSSEITSVDPLCIGSEIAELFEKNDFHHIPVVNSNNKPVGIISASDYYQLQHHFTRLQLDKSKEENKKIFRSVLAQEIMTPNPVCMEEDASIGDAVDIFIKNKIRALIILKDGKLAGIVTPIDILKSVVGPALIDR